MPDDNNLQTNVEFGAPTLTINETPPKPAEDQPTTQVPDDKNGDDKD